MRSRVYPILLLAAASLAVFLTGRDFLAVHEQETIVRGPGVTRGSKLSAYFSGLAGTAGDSAVYILEGEQPGGTLFVMGGVHANEPAGMLSAVLLVENARVKKGRLIVLPQANASGATYVEPSEGFPEKFTVRTAWGSRWFRFGGRLTNPVHQWPDPEVYTHYPSGQLQSDFDVRNLDRAFPGRPDGCFTEKIAFGIAEMIRREKADLVVDFHEARPMNPIVNCVVFHDRAREIATMASIDLDMAGMKLRLEPSPKNLHGISHRELGDHTGSFALLMETANPIMDKLHGPTSEELIMTGKDDFFLRAAQKGLLYVPYDANGIPMEERVARHLTGLLEFARIFGELSPGREIVIEGIPSFQEMKERGVGAFLLKPPA